jgi:hypothetical protein
MPKEQSESGTGLIAPPLLVDEAQFELSTAAGICARITVVSGRSTHEFHSKRLGHKIITFLYENKYVTIQDSLSLRAILDESDLSQEYSDLDEEFFPTQATAIRKEEIFAGSPPVYVM